MGYIRVYLGEKLVDQMELSAERTRIGRAAENELVLADPGVSRHHATIVREGARFFIEDNQSSNRVFLNKSHIERAELSYWDEIQIYNYVLKFMAVPRRQAEIDRDVAEADTRIDRTMVASIEDVAKLEQLRKQKRQAYLVRCDMSGNEEQRHLLKSVTFSLGRAGGADIRIGGWFAPKVAACIERNGAIYMLVPGKRGRVVLNDKMIETQQELRDGDRFEVRGARFQFFVRLADAS